MPDIRELLAFAAAPDCSCAQVITLPDGHILTVQQRLKSLRLLEQQS